MPSLNLTAVEMVLVTPEGNPIANAQVDIVPTKSSFNETDEGIVMPRPATAVTDAEGKCTVSLWPSQIPYLVSCKDTASEAELFYRFVVPDALPEQTVRLQDILIDNGVGFNGAYFEMTSDTNLKVSARGRDGVLRHVNLTLTP